jgi:hypothetical protein
MPASFHTLLVPHLHSQSINLKVASRELEAWSRVQGALERKYFLGHCCTEAHRLAEQFTSSGQPIRSKADVNLISQYLLGNETLQQTRTLTFTFENPPCEETMEKKPIPP